MNFDKVISQKYGSNEIEYGIVKGNGDVALLIKVGQGCIVWICGVDKEFASGRKDSIRDN